MSGFGFGSSPPPPPSFGGGGGGGFGTAPGGFGTPQQPQQQQAGGFGTPAQQQQQQQPGFGTSQQQPPGFGSAPAAAAATGGGAPSFGTSVQVVSGGVGGGFGTVAGGGFGSQAPPVASTGFPNTAFGTQQQLLQQQGAQAPPPPPAAAAAAAPPVFGVSSTVASSSPSVAAVAAAAAATVPSSGFGFGGGGNIGNATGSATGSAFGGGSGGTAFGQQQQPAVSNPFGGDASVGGGGEGTGTALSFGTSANVAQSAFGQGGQGGHSNEMTGGFGGSAALASTNTASLASTGGGGGFASTSSSGGGGFGSAATAASVFGGGSSGAFGAAAGSSSASNHDDGGMMGDDSSSSAFPTQPSLIPLGAIPRKKKKPPGSSSDRGASGSSFGGRGAAPHGGEDNMGPSSSATSGLGGGGGGGGNELSRLKAKLEAKKKKLEEQKKQRAEKQHQQQHPQDDESVPAAEGGSGGDDGESSRPRASFSPFNPKSSRGSTPSPVPTRGKRGGGGSQIDKAAMAAKNAERFATKTDRTTRSLLPSDLRKKVQAIEEGREDGEIPESQQQDDDDDDEEDEGGKGALSKAKSLQGICRTMCPDEELLRREKEGDIQMLETPDPGGLHPADWTLRDTAVKRFRRSAADFKLDIPELVRPPSVLERCCAYLEEWVMERDRQGPDSRYSGSVPPSLDVYQFIWDRTRMIRKDFILQNYVGTGARCSASAVRCHERIARWHAMVEHQLSHISDYVVQQSQQNIQELGQTMKTLNFYYDDAEARATLEESDADAMHGCQNNIIMGGQAPVDYDGSALRNVDDGSSSASLRIIGQSNHPSRGTAEPEMRGLYILLTLNNDGGMEVLKYAASLYVNRPEIYNSRPVQLALSVFRAKKDYNYARFFSILRSPDTPYLFACIMFKYVEQMRKAALRIMAKTFGARKKDTGENFYDKYSLRDLVHLLSFESEDEAREACQHYNLSVVKGEDGGAMGGEWVEWRKSDFREKKDPKKGHVVRLRPWKMVKTIESKLNGATRLTVCRGEVSGEGATLSQIRSPGPMSSQEMIAAQQQQQRKLTADAEQRAKDADRLQQQKEAAEKIEAVRRRKAEEEDAKVAELKRLGEEKESRRKEAEEKERQHQLALKRAEQERGEKLRREAQEKKRLEDETRAREAERIKREKEAAARAEAERRKAEEEARLAAIERQRQEEIKRAEAAEKERQRQLALERAEEERRISEAKRLAEEEAARAAEAARIAEEARLKRIREEEERREREWQRKLDFARKIMAFRRWRKRVDEQTRGARLTRHTLEQVDPTSMTPRSLSRATTPTSVALQSYQAEESQVRPEYLFYSLGNLSGRMIDMASYIGDGLVNSLSPLQEAADDPMHPRNLTETSSSHSVSMFKMAVIMPTFLGADDANLFETLSLWIHSRFAFNVQCTNKRIHNNKHVEVRSIIVESQEQAESYAGCDNALFIIPPFDSLRRDECFSFLSKQASHLSKASTPSVILNLHDGSDSSDQVLSQMIRNLIDMGGVKIVGEVSPHWTAEGLDSSLASCCDMIRSAFVGAQVVDGEVFTIDRVSLPQLGRLCLRNILWNTDHLVDEASAKATERSILHLLKETLRCLVLELNYAANDMKRSLLASWPSPDFVTNRQLPQCVENYWYDGAALPLNWLSSSHASTSSSPMDSIHIESVLSDHFEIFRTSKTISAIVEPITAAASGDVKEICQKMLWDAQYRHALDNALAYQDSTSVPVSTYPSQDIIYLPRCEIAGIVERTLKRVSDMYAPKDEVPALTAETAAAIRFPASHTVVDAEWKASSWKPTAALSRGKRRSQHDGDNESSAYPARKKKRQRSSKKRPGSMRKKPMTADQKQSMAFSARLEELLHGDSTLDINIGDVALSDILANTGGDIELPKDLVFK